MKKIITILSLLVSLNSFGQDREGEIQTFEGTLVTSNKNYICLTINGEADYFFFKASKYDKRIPCKMNNVRLNKGVKLRVKVKAVKIYLRPIHGDGTIEMLVWKPIEITRAAQY